MGDWFEYDERFVVPASSWSGRYGDSLMRFDDFWSTFFLSDKEWHTGRARFGPSVAIHSDLAQSEYRKDLVRSALNAASIQGRTLIAESRIGAASVIGQYVGAYDRSPEDDREVTQRDRDLALEHWFTSGGSSRARPHVTAEYFDTVIFNSSIGGHNQIATSDKHQAWPHSTLLDSVTTGSDVYIEPGVVVRHADIGHDAWLLEGVVVNGDAADEPVVIGPYARIEEGVQIDAGAVIGAHVTVGRAAHILAGATVTENVDAGTTVFPEEPPEAAERGLVEQGVVMGMDARYWVLTKLAQIAEALPKQRLTKVAIRTARPELLNLAVTKEALRITPPATSEQLLNLAAEHASEYPKYLMKLHAEGWTGEQRFTERNNDVMLFDLTEEAIERFVRAEDEPGEDEEEQAQTHALRRAALELLFAMPPKEVGWHPGAEDPFGVGWARFVQYPERRAILLEELQSDLYIIVRNRPQSPSPERLAERANELMREQGLRAAFMSERTAIKHAERRYADPRRQRQYIAEQWVVVDSIDTLALTAEVQELLSDFYPTVMGAMLQWAFDQGVEEVYYPTYDTKAVVAASPPKSVYEKLPKRFQAAPVVASPAWLPLGGGLFDRERDKLQQGKSFRLLRPNR